MAENGEDKLIAMARHIAKTLGRTETMTDDILQIFSTFDGRFSRERLSENLGSQDDGGADDDHPFPATLDCTLRSLDRQISRFVVSDRPIWSDSADSAAFLDAVDALLATIREFDTAMPGDRSLLDRTDDLLQQTMLRLEDEFRSLMEQQDVASSPLDPVSGRSSPYESDGDETDGDDRIPVAHPVTDYDIVIDALPSGSIADLHGIAKRMVAAGYGKECAHAYSISRRNFLEESISRLGLRPRTMEEVQGTPWPDLEDEIGRWTRAINVAVRILFPSERRLCDRVFAGLTPVTELSFAEVCRGPAIQLLGFANAVAIGNGAPERLFRIVDLYEAVSDLMPEIDSVFSDQYCSFLRSEAGSILKRLGTSIRGIFTELENLIRRDPAKAAVPGGGFHPITRYVMNYLRAACASRRTLEEVMEEEEGRALPLADHDRPSSSLSVQLAWVMELLQGNLEAKSKVYRDPSLSCVFLMNNGRYIIQKVRDSELGSLLGEDWIRRQMARERQWLSGYQRSSWSKVIAVLRVDGGGASSSTSMTPKTLKEKFRVFNQYLEEICRVQAGWVVADERLRSELRSSIAGSVLPAYQNYMARFRDAVEKGKNGERYAKYSAEAVKARINELFQGTGKRE